MLTDMVVSDTVLETATNTQQPVINLINDMVVSDTESINSYNFYITGNRN